MHMLAIAPRMALLTARRTGLVPWSWQSPVSIEYFPFAYSSIFSPPFAVSIALSLLPS
jgi:hypothetical protein